MGEPTSPSVCGPANWFAQKHDRLEEAWPIDRIRSWWEELTWRWWEEIKTSYRELVLQMGGINPTKDDLKSQALAPAPDGLSVFRMPTAFQRLNLEAYFQTVCMARQDRQHQRMMAKQFNEHLASASKRKTKAAGEDICKMYVSTGGKCYRGDTCRFAHPPGLPPPPGLPEDNPGRGGAQPDGGKRTKRSLPH